MTVSFQPLNDPAPEDFELRDVASYTVQRPSNIAAHELVGSSIPLAGQDLAMPDLYMSTVLFFSADKSPLLQAMTVDDVKAAFDAGLEQLVAQYPAASSNFHKDDQGTWRMRYTDVGVPVILAESARELGTAYIGCGGRVDDNVCPRSFHVSDHSQPGLVIKVSRFSCGSIAIGTSTHHWIVDYAGYYDMMQLLARAISDPLRPLPPRDHSRNMLKLISSVPSEDIPVDEWFVPNGPGVWDKRDFKLPPGNVTNVMVHFSRRKLEQLKFETIRSAGELPADQRPGVGKWISTNDALAALLWSSVTAARRLSGSGNSRLVLTVDGRRYIPNCDEYVGNVHTMHNSVGNLDTLVAQTPASVLKTSLLLREDLNNLTEGKMASVVRLQQEDLTKLYAPNYQPFFGHDVLISNLTKYDWSRVPFGPFGSPIHASVVTTAPIKAGSLRISGSDGAVFVLNAPHGFVTGTGDAAGSPTSLTGASDASSGSDDWRKPGVIALIGLREADLETFRTLPLIARYGDVLA